MLSISKDANKNYLAKIIALDGVHKHPNADRLQVAQVDYQNVILGPDAKDGDIYVFFPLECTINPEFLKATNSFRDKTLNADNTQAGFFESNGRVRAVKLRGEKSMGYAIPVKTVMSVFGSEFLLSVGEEFDMVGDTQICKKYEVYVKPARELRTGKKPRISRLIDGQVHLHVDTENLRKNMYKISPADMISISYKMHGTSFWVSNVLTKRKLSLKDKIARFFGSTVQESEYSLVYGSRKVVKNEYETQNTNDFYGEDLWGEIAEKLAPHVAKGFTLYGEAVGYTTGGKAIQAKYDYGQEQGTYGIYIYRITFTNSDGLVSELSTHQILQFCADHGLNAVPVFCIGSAHQISKEMGVDYMEEHWHANFMKALEAKYNDKDCVMCKNVVPEEGIVLRVEKHNQFEAYKLKSYRFLEHETAMLDQGVEIDS